MIDLYSRDEAQILRAWDSVAPKFRRKYVKSGCHFKDIAYQLVFTELIKEIIKTGTPHSTIIVKTDLWNEGIEYGRDLASPLCMGHLDVELVGTDVSGYVCRSALSTADRLFHVVNATLLCPPFRKVFDMILDPSTIDHMSRRLRETWVKAEHDLLKDNGILVISFDSKLNLFSELYHRFLTRKQYPEWTLTPGEVRAMLTRLGFRIIREHALFIPGLFLGWHSPWFPLGLTLTRRRVFELIKLVELSDHSKFLSFLAPQYVLVAQKQSNQAQQPTTPNKHL